MTTIRELFVELGIKTDTAPLQKFDSAVSKIKNNIHLIGLDKAGEELTGFSKNPKNES